MDDSQIAKLLEKYLDGTCSEEEVKVIDAWYLRYEDREKILELLPEDKRSRLKEEMLLNILQGISHDKRSISKILWPGVWLKVAAAALVLLVLNLAYNSYFKDEDSFQGIQQKTVANHSRKMIKQLLPDSSMVWLNPNASIQFPEKFSGKTREIVADGECFFEVTKNPEKPFIIRSAHLITKVWGTSFKVADGRNLGFARVTVATGKVSVSVREGRTDKATTSLNEQEVVLLPNDQATLNGAGQRLTKKTDVNVDELKKYERVSLKFENTTLHNMVQVLKRNFDVDMRIANDTLGTRVMDADLTELNLPEILEVLKASMSLDYELNQGIIVLKIAK